MALKLRYRMRQPPIPNCQWYNLSPSTQVSTSKLYGRSLSRWLSFSWTQQSIVDNAQIGVTTDPPSEYRIASRYSDYQRSLIQSCDCCRPWSDSPRRTSECTWREIRQRSWDVGSERQPMPRSITWSTVPMIIITEKQKYFHAFRYLL